MTIYVASFKEFISPDSMVVNTTSRSRTWSKELSPFFLGPIKLYGSHQALNVENSWQFSKVYPSCADEHGEPNDQYWEWAKKGWADSYAHRYPMGKGAMPLYSYWDGKHLSYIEARKEIYIRLYAKAVRETEAFAKLQDLTKLSFELGKDIYLTDFDGYNHKVMGMSYEDVINDPSRKMGHAFVLAMMLDKQIILGE